MGLDGEEEGQECSWRYHLELLGFHQFWPWMDARDELESWLPGYRCLHIVQKENTKDSGDSDLQLSSLPLYALEAEKMS